MTVIGVLHPGEMGSAVAGALRERGHTVLWASGGRSEASAKRARDAGLEDVGDVAELCRRCEILLSICPPHAATEVARQTTGFAGLYVDANAIAPATARAIAAIHGRFVDGGIVGPPPLEPGTTRLYLSGSGSDEIATLFAGTNVDARAISGESGAASALKAAYAGWTKGSAALLLTVRELARAEGVEDALLEEWRLSIPELEERLAGAERSAERKGWRWIGEMEEIALAMRSNDLPAGFHEAAADVFPESAMINIADYAEAARAKVAAETWCYFEGGAGDEVTLRRNVAAYERWQLRPRLLVDVSRVTTATTLLGSEVASPLGIAPFAMQSLLDPDGELATARAAAAAGALMTVSTLTTRTHGEIRGAAGTGPRWFQLYVLKDRERTLDHMHEAREAGYSALVLTVDAPYVGRRERDLRLGFQNPPPGLHLPYANLFEMTPELTWRDLEWIRAEMPLPIVIKGILTREDAELAVEHGADAVWVSNHGGRQLDGVAAGLEALPEVAEAIAGRCEVYVDGGIRRGTDVLKALALGADAAFAARAFACALAVDGEAGVAHALSLLQAELELGLGLLGCTSPKQVTRAHVQPAVA